jgi:diguanylate cyclase (GGDEF)-like protein/PAS domain S-box-containing protein
VNWADKIGAVRVISSGVTAIAVAVAISLPSVYFAVNYHAVATSTATKAEIKAESLTALVTSAPATWTFQGHRLEELLARHPVQQEFDSARIYSARGELVAEAGKSTDLFRIERDHGIYDSGTLVGTVAVAHSAWPLLIQTSFLGALGLLLGAGVLVFLRKAPLRALRRAIAELNDERERAVVTLHSIGDAVITTDPNELIQYLNPVAEQLIGWTSAEVQGWHLRKAFRLVNEVTGAPVDSPLTCALLERRIVPLANHTALVRRDGTTISIEDSAAPIISKTGALIGGILVFHDVSAARDMAHELSWQATHDALTGLVNRREFERRMEALIARKSDKRSVLCYLDLDQFKIVNDTSGHVAGDELLKQLSALLQEETRASDTVARLGGDEFGLLLEGCSIDKGKMICEKIQKAVSAFRFSWEEKIFGVDVSAGLVEITKECGSNSDVLSAADAACYRAKAKGPGRLEVFELGDKDLTKRREDMGWVERITRAVDENRLVLYAQPYKSLTRSAQSELHVELLLRMIDEAGNVVLPGAFLPAAERYDLMPIIDRWVIRSAFSSIKACQTRLGQPTIFGINLSGASINAEFLLDYVEQQAALHDIDPRSICFEVTETVAINQIRQAARLMRELKSRGFRFALDDFGVGMSSFAYLKNLPVDYLKIDGSFVKELGKDEISRTLVRAINEVGHAMGLQTIAEWVESEAILAVLREIGVDYAQGYAFAKPAPLDEIGSIDNVLRWPAQPVVVTLSPPLELSV